MDPFQGCGSVVCLGVMVQPHPPVWTPFIPLQGSAPAPCSPAQPWHPPFPRPSLWICPFWTFPVSGVVNPWSSVSVLSPSAQVKSTLWLGVWGGGDFISSGEGQPIMQTDHILIHPSVRDTRVVSPRGLPRTGCRPCSSHRSGGAQLRNRGLHGSARLRGPHTRSTPRPGWCQGCKSRVRGHVVGKRLFPSTLFVFFASGTRTGPFKWIKKAREFNVLQEYNCIFIAHYISS